MDCDVVFVVESQETVRERMLNLTKWALFYYKISRRILNINLAADSGVMK